MRSSRIHRRVLRLLLTAVFALSAGVLLGTLPCGPFTDLSSGDPFCPFVLEIFTLGITTGTTPTTYDPAANVTRLQMAAFLSRTVDGVLNRGSRRAALKKFWTPQNATVLGLTTVVNGPTAVESDGEDLWTANSAGASVSRVHGSGGKLLETWTGADFGQGVLIAMGRVFVTGSTSPGRLYQIDPTQPAGMVSTVASNLGNGAFGIAFDGSQIWTANLANSVSIVTPGMTVPWTVTTVTTGFRAPVGVLHDGGSIWVTNAGVGVGVGALLRLDGAGAILQTATVGRSPWQPVFDGTNIWVPNADSSSVSVVRASSATVLMTLTGNGLTEPFTAAFDGQRVLVTNNMGASVSLWKAADFTALGSFPLGGQPGGACSDGIYFWITLANVGKLARF